MIKFNKAKKKKIQTKQNFPPLSIHFYLILCINVTIK